MRDLLAQKEQEWEAKLDRGAGGRSGTWPSCEKERAYSSLQNYLAQAMMENGEHIAPRATAPGRLATPSRRSMPPSPSWLPSPDEIAGETQQRRRQSRAGSDPQDHLSTLGPSWMSRDDTLVYGR